MRLMVIFPTVFSRQDVYPGTVIDAKRGEALRLLSVPNPKFSQVSSDAKPKRTSRAQYMTTYKRQKGDLTKIRAHYLAEAAASAPGPDEPDEPIVEEADDLDDALDSALGTIELDGDDEDDENDTR